eukprot:CAMPEP_0176492634 /NCGR_PEP_ID=MMETSP0200_2-20121128/9112_1 /TAXON_ID=947934 /ORGANISM="Chaetoceros sp., Strain GSL56" /LENGTH=645 /DNA_ID=CAMNT_0017890227 /DNA_START=58 /DNA_END=1998 /DNA_ORIENTATION=+
MHPSFFQSFSRKVLDRCTAASSGSPFLIINKAMMISSVSSSASVATRSIGPWAVATGLASGIAFSTFLYGESTSEAISTTQNGASSRSNKKDKTYEYFLAGQNDDKKGQQAANLRKRMTAIGKFSLRSQTDSNPSQPTFFLALSNHTRDKSVTKDPTMTASEFRETWYRKNMHRKHPRFHSKVSSCGDFFEPVNYYNSKYSEGVVDTYDSHVSETLHMNVYRQDLKNRIETFLTDVMDVTEKLWEVQISSGDVGTSGGISHKRSQELWKETQELQPTTSGSGSGSGTETIPKETIMLFRSHHSLADAVSIVAALGDLLDEAEEIKEKIKCHLDRQKKKIQKCSTLQKLWKFIKSFMWFLFGSIQAIMRHGYLILTTPRNPFLDVQELSNSGGHCVNMNSAGCGRSISWCDVAPVDEAKRVAKTIGGPKTTVNDVFVSCVTAAVAKQLAQHRRCHKTSCDTKTRSTVHKYNTINVVIPAHLAGGILPPGREIGNLIGAFVAKVPGELDERVSPTDRLKMVHKSLVTVKGSPASILSYMFAKFASNYLPEPLAKTLFLKSNANAAVAITNSKGYEQKVHINGRTVENMAGFYPLPPGLPIGVVVQSYGNTISLSVTAEKWAVPDADIFLDWILEEYRLLYAEACAMS